MSFNRKSMSDWNKHESHYLAYLKKECVNISSIAKIIDCSPSLCDEIILRWNILSEPNSMVHVLDSPENKSRYRAFSYWWEYDNINAPNRKTKNERALDIFQTYDIHIISRVVVSQILPNDCLNNVRHGIPDLFW